MKADSDSYNAGLAFSLGSLCEFYKEDEVIQKVITICRDQDSWSERLDPVKNRRYFVVALDVAMSIVERAAICSFSKLEYFELQKFHKYFWEFALTNYSNNFKNESKLALEILEVYVVNFNYIPYFVNCENSNIAKYIERLAKRISSMREKEYSLLMTGTSRRFLEKFFVDIFNKANAIKNVPLDDEIKWSEAVLSVRNEACEFIGRCIQPLEMINENSKNFNSYKEV